MTESDLLSLLRAIEPDHGLELLLSSDDLALLENYVEGDDPYLAERAASLASMIDDPEATRVLDLALQSTYEQVRIAAANGLWRNSTEPTQALSRALSDTSIAVRRFALRSVGTRLQDRGPISPELADRIRSISESGPDAATSAAARLLAYRVNGEAPTVESFNAAVLAGVSANDLTRLIGSETSDLLSQVVE
jgi:spore germination cell wall hydrolase CwlJ-like protein